MVDGRANALGIRRTRSKPCQGETDEPRSVFLSPLQGFGFFPSQTQGVALGWLLDAPLVLRGKVHDTLSHRNDYPLPNMKRNLILTTVHRINSAALAPFFQSLHATGCKSEMVVFASALDDASLRQLEDWGARVVPFRFRGKHVFNDVARLWWLWRPLFASGLSTAAKERLAHFSFHLFYRRHLLYLDFLREYGTEYQSVFLTDSRDVFFQADPFGWEPTPGLHCFLEEEKNKLGTCVHHVEWITSQFGSATLAAWATDTVSCAGTVFGDVPGMFDYLNQMVSATMKVKSLRAAAGDQGVHNYLLRAGLLSDVTLHENRGGPVMTLGPMQMSDLRLDHHGAVLNDAGAVVPILHQYDRISELRESLLSQLAPELPAGAVDR